jgi:hypothetical protein
VTDAPERYTIAVMFRAFLDAAAAMGLREVVSAAQPALKAMFDRPPLPTAMVPGSVCDLLYASVAQARGRSAVRTLGYEGMRREGSRLLGGLFENTMALYGRTPDALFGQIATIVGPVVSRIDVTYLPESPQSGFVEVRPAGQRTPLSYAIWEGYLHYFFDVCGTRGTVDEFVLAANGLSGTARVHWES